MTASAHPFENVEVEVIRTVVTKKIQEKVMKKVYDIVPDEVLEAASKVEIKTSRERQVISEIMAALRARRPIHIAYENAAGEASVRYVDVGSVRRTKKDDALTFNGFDHNRKEMRTFRADRVVQIGIG